MAQVLVVGGAGYIGSHMVRWLAQRGHEVVCFDNLSTGHRDAVFGGTFFEGDLANRDTVKALFDSWQFDGVMHFASSIQVGESWIAPAKYYRNNVANTLNLLDAMVDHGVRHLVFSSSAAVYGEPLTVPIPENHPTNPLSPYGRSKLMVEQMLEDYDRAYDLKSVSLRYFNAAGCDPEGVLGERHEPETHLIPLALRAALGKGQPLTIFGNDYPTPDGTCIRDYIHVLDLCQAHWLAMQKLFDGHPRDIFNLGNGVGFSVNEILSNVETLVGHPVPISWGDRRPGDPAALVANCEKATSVLGWQPEHCSISAILQHALAWERQSSIPA